MVANISRQIVEITPVMRKSPEKQTKDSVFNSSVRLAVSLALLRRFESPIHFFSIWIMSSPSVMLRIALEMSATSGEPLGKACPSIGVQEGKYGVLTLKINVQSEHEKNALSGT